MWIRARSAKSLGLLVALFVSLFVFVIAAGEARAEEQGGLPGTQWPQWCAAPPDGRGSATSPTDQPRRPKILPEGALPTPSSTTDPKPASSAPRTDGSLGSQPSPAPDQLPAAKGVPPTAKGVPTSPPQVGGRVGREAGALRCGERVGAGTFSGSRLGGRAFNGALGGRTARAACPP